MKELEKINKKKFVNEPFVKEVKKPWGKEVIFTPSNLPYAGKIIYINDDQRLSLQLHDQKQESWFLLKGRGKVIWENSKGELIDTELAPNQGYTCNIGQKHRLVGIEDCVILEVSTQEIGTTYRLEDDYSRPDETEKMRKEERKKL